MTVCLYYWTKQLPCLLHLLVCSPVVETTFHSCDRIAATWPTKRQPTSQTHILPLNRKRSSAGRWKTCCLSVWRRIPRKSHINKKYTVLLRYLLRQRCVAPFLRAQSTRLTGGREGSTGSSRGVIKGAERHASVLRRGQPQALSRLPHAASEAVLASP